MVEYRDPTLPPGAPTDRTATGRVTPVAPAASGGMSRWIWIAAAVVVALVVLFMVFGGDDDSAVAPTGGDAVVTDPAAPATNPVAPVE